LTGLLIAIIIYLACNICMSIPTNVEYETLKVIARSA
jgi:hypothetical protein